MRTENKKAQFLYRDYNYYKGCPRVSDFKTRASRIVRRTAKQILAQDCAKFDQEW